MKFLLVILIAGVVGYGAGLGMEVVAFQDNAKIIKLAETGHLDEEWIPFSGINNGKISKLSSSLDQDYSFGLIKQAELAQLLDMIDSAYLDFTIQKTKVDPDMTPDTGDEFFVNEISECVFQTDDSVSFDTCIICQLKNETGHVVADGRIDLPGITAGQVETIPITNFEYPYSNDVRDVHGVGIAVCDQEGGDGCTPGYWKQSQHFGSWSFYDPVDPGATHFEDIVDRDLTITVGGDPHTDIPNPTMLEALSANNQELGRLVRHTAAALLNANSTGVGYTYSTATIIGNFQTSFDSGDYNLNGWADDLEFSNELGCPLGNDPLDEEQEVFSEAGTIDTTSYDGSTVTPLEKMQHAKQTLDTLFLDSTVEQSTTNSLMAAISSLNTALDSQYWVDDYHIDVINGDVVLENSRLAVIALVDITNSGESQSVKDNVQTAIDDLLNAANELAQTSINDVDECGGKNPKVDGHLSSSLSKITDAQADYNSKKYSKSLEKFYDAWEEAFFATGACPSGYWTQFDGYEVVEQ